MLRYRLRRSWWCRSKFPRDQRQVEPGGELNVRNLSVSLIDFPLCVSVSQVRSFLFLEKFFVTICEHRTPTRRGSVFRYSPDAVLVAALLRCVCVVQLHDSRARRGSAESYSRNCTVTRRPTTK